MLRGHDARGHDRRRAQGLTVRGPRARHLQRRATPGTVRRAGRLACPAASRGPRRAHQSGRIRAALERSVPNPAVGAAARSHGRPAIRSAADEGGTGRADAERDPCRDAVTPRGENRPREQPDHPARRPRRVLRGGRAARPAGAPRQAGHRRRRRARPARGRERRQLRGPQVRRPLRDAPPRRPAASARRACSCPWTGASTSRRAARSWRSSAGSRRRCSRSRSTRRSWT